jgi:hypothetical protein
VNRKHAIFIFTTNERNNKTNKTKNFAIKNYSGSTCLINFIKLVNLSWRDAGCTLRQMVEDVFD